MMTRYIAKLIMQNGSFVALPYRWDTLQQAYEALRCWVRPENPDNLVTNAIVGFQVTMETVG